MKLISTLRSPYRVRSLVHPGATGSVSDAALGRAIVLTQLVLLALSIARVEADWVEGPLGLEAGIALAVIVAVVGSLAVKSMRWAVRQARRGGRGGPRGLPSKTPLLGGNHVRAS